MKNDSYCWQANGIEFRAVYTESQRQHCDDASDTVVIENNGVATKWVATPFPSDSFVFNENRIASVIAVLTMTLSVNGVNCFAMLREVSQCLVRFRVASSP